MRVIKGKLTKSIKIKLKTGQEVLYSGTVYTARDQAHKRLSEAIRKKKKLPIDLKDAIIYYTGPTPSKYRNKVGSAGPTTSSRMDKFTPVLLNAGVGALIGKGNRSAEVVNSIRKNRAVYFLAVGGAGAYLGKRIKEAKIVAYKDLGAEAIYKMEVRDFPLIVGVDSRGKNIYKDNKY
jgi:fumarate hydratase subunit beta